MLPAPPPPKKKLKNYCVTTALVKKGLNYMKWILQLSPGILKVRISVHKFN